MTLEDREKSNTEASFENPANPDDSVVHKTPPAHAEDDADKSRSGGEPVQAGGRGDGNDSSEMDQAVELPIDGTLDLHMFSPRDVKELVPAYIEECLARGILDLRIVHGKGIGVLRTVVQAILDEHPAVIWYGHRSDAGSWGATVVKLARPDPPHREQTEAGHDA